MDNINDVHSNTRDETERDSSMKPPKLSPSQIAGRTLNAGSQQSHVSSIDTKDTANNIKYFEPEELLRNSYNTSGAVVRLREGLLRLKAGTQKVNRRYLATVLELGYSVKNDDRKIKDLHDIISWMSKSVGTGPRIGVQSGPLRKLGTARLS